MMVQMELNLANQADYFWALLPEILLSAWAMLVLLVDVSIKGSRSEPSRPVVAWLAVLGVVAAAVANGFLATVSVEPGAAVMAVDNFRVYVNFVILAATGLTLLMSMGYLDRRGINLGEYHALVLFAAVGMMLMAGARDLMMIFIALELMSIAVYVLVGFDRLDARSAEAGLKYFLLGAFSSAFFLFGVALTWGSVGTTDIPTLGSLVLGGAVEVGPMLLAGMGMLLVGFGFKVAAMPFHMWTPDAYDGAPTPVTSLMSTGVKAAAFAAFIRVFLTGFGGAQDQWLQVGVVIAMLTMVGANLVALTEGSIKRMLAYSSIAHAGYLLVALLSNSRDGVAAFLFYLLVYTLMTAGAFAILIANSRENGEERVALEDWQGFATEKPLLAALFSVFLLSLAGFPLTAGFLGKLYILRAAVGSGLSWLAVVLVLASLVSYFYYLRIVVVMYMRPVRVSGEHMEAGLPGPARFATTLAAALVVLLFFFGAFNPLPRPLHFVAGPMLWADWSSGSIFEPAEAAVPVTAATEAPVPVR